MQKTIILVVVLFSSLLFYNVSRANHDVLKCVGNQGYVNGAACAQGSHVWGSCNSNSCYDANGDGVDNGDDATITGCTTYGGSMSCGHYVKCPRCPIISPCKPSWSDVGECDEECGPGIQKQNDGCGNKRSIKCNEGVCLGECGTLNGNVYDYTVNTWPNGTFCIPDSVTEPVKYAVSNPNPVPFPTFDTESEGCSAEKPCMGKRSWDCITEAGGTENGACSVTLSTPTVECGEADGIEVNSAPDEDLCLASLGRADIKPLVSLGSEGKWVWGCVHDAYVGIVDACSAPSCLSELPVEYQQYVYFDSKGDPNNSSVSVTCPGVCCEIEGAVSGVTPDLVVCYGDNDKFVEVEPGVNTYPTRCWFGGEVLDTGDVLDIENTLIIRVSDISVNTMCAARECNAQGTCQSTPVLADSYNSPVCTSSCNSNADCSSGKMIEAQP